MGLDDRELVSKAKAGDRKAFDELVRNNRDKMFALIYRMTGDRETALDLMQDTFFTAYKELSRFRQEANFSSWLYRVASNKTLNYLKRRKILSFLPLARLQGSEPTVEMESSIENTEVSAALLKRVDELPAKQKLIFNLRYYQELSFVEIARILKKSESTVKTNYQKAIEKLRLSLKEWR
ncbi:MAG: RNA polymerase sigma factor [bacterium]|jgi:RNA polymerase sigma-70 factor (ECF subfamily)